jgi:hypothetical protein
VGSLAREALGGGRTLPPPFSPIAQVQSADAIADRTETLFEATLVAEGLLARPDALVPRSNGWELIEVKSGKMPEDGIVSDEYLDDVAYTLCVAHLAQVPIDRVSLMLLSREYRAGASTPLFERLDVTDAAMARAAELRSVAPHIVAALTAPERPPASLRTQCRQCDYFATRCIGVGVDDSLLRVPRISATKIAELAPCERVSALPASASFTALQQRTVDLIRSRGVFRDPSVLSRLSTIRWPAFYLDFETVMPALPWFSGDGVYTVLPNQFSVHICESLGTPSRHIEYLAPLGVDWRQELVERLLSALEGDGSIVVYSSYEKTQLNAMADRFPAMRQRIHAVIERLFDLEPFFKSGYVDHRFAGSSSIKKVLPVLVPDLSYDALAVGNGSDASGLFCLMALGEIPASEHDVLRQELLRYCRLDTMAMVRLHEVLAQL